MTQTKRMSLIESMVNTLVGLIVTMVFSPAIYWICGVKMSFPQMGLATFLFTILSVARNYIIRRFFKNKV